MAIIWIVEDDVNLANLAKTVLVKEGYEVEVFYEARKVIKKAKKIRPDLILMDITLPGIDGTDAVIELRKDPKLGSIPVIFMTGLISNTDGNQEEMGILIDGVRYKTLGKPCGIEQLLKMVGKVVRS